MPPRQPSDSRRHSPDDSFRHVPTEGSIRLPDGQRAAAVPVEFIHGLHASLAQELGESAPRTLYACGYEWALQAMIRLTQRLREESGGGTKPDLWQMDARLVLDRWWAPLNAAGWGAWTLDLTAHAKGLTFVEVQNSAVVAEPAQHKPVKPVCHLYAGLFAGALSFFGRGESHAVEIQCAALGHPSCRFVIGPGAQIDAVESWRQQGVSVGEIHRRLT